MSDEYIDLDEVGKPKKPSEVIDEVGIQKEAIDLVRREKITFEYQYIFVTRKVAFNTKFLIEQLRKNYWGIFDTPQDPVSGKTLTWIPLTEWICDVHVAQTRVSTKDFKFKALTDKGIGFVLLVKHLVTNWLNKEVFGEDLEKMERELAINGSHVWKTYEGTDENGKPKVMKSDVDLLNVFFDMTSNSIQEAYRFTERAILTKEQCEEMDAWINVDKIVPTQGIHRLDQYLGNSVLSTNMLVDVWETWGKIPMSLITGKKTDEKTEIDGHIVVSGLQSKGNELVHLIETNPGGKKPYEEAHTKKIAGRWLGRGPAESVMMMQIWLNMLVNIRKLRNQVSQLGIFKVKKGTAVAPAVLSRMAANGVIMVNNMDDIESMVIPPENTSMNEEANIVGWSRRVTSTFEAVTGENIPRRESPVVFQMEKAAGQTSFAVFSDTIGFFLQRWMKRHALPILMKTLTKGEQMRMTMEPDELDTYDDMLVNYYAYQKLDELEKNGEWVDIDIVNREIDNAKSKLRKMGRERFVTLMDDINLEDYEAVFYTNAENFDEQAIAKNLIEALQLAPQYAQVILPQVFDIMGLDSAKLHDLVSKPVAPANPALGPGQDPNQMMPGKGMPISNIQQGPNNSGPIIPGNRISMQKLAKVG